ncbi:Peroxidase 68 [Cinnamomum micranthum f. kanehirae]|uniref:peroxidase n=1 Tax=Cinnamomum micranthum f. kanehirae TaxID=337451 RepID=A0A443NRU8_9MAGN|nr:Peroxidase 68 [Cinnamomum micranthum f. kanehirae]
MAFFFFSFALSLILILGVTSAQLSSTYYSSSCPNALSTIESAVTAAVASEKRMGASLLRLHFHDCFVNGCDGSILLDDTSSFTGEKTANPNANSVRGFDVIDTIKSQLESLCPQVVSCADILAVAARDAVVALGGPTWTVQLGRRDSTTASLSDANSDIPQPTFDLSALITAFTNKGLTAKEMVALSGSHTIGQARCSSFRARIYNETNIDSSLATSLKSNCPSTGSDDNLSPLDTSTPTVFDNSYYENLVNQKGLLHSDQQLYSGGSTDSQAMASFFFSFASSLILIFAVASAQLSSTYYSSSCPKALSTINSAVTAAVASEKRMGASLLRLHFHDCFVNGCDGSILLDDTSSFTGEKTANPNANSVRGFDVVDTIKSQLESLCPKVVSCADILAVAARDSVVALGGPTWTVQLGRRDSTTASLSTANSDIPQPTFNLSALITAFTNKGLTAKEMVALSGSHTIGQARCTSFRARIYNETNIDSSLATSLKSNCPSTGGDNNLSPLDASTPTVFDNSYYKNLVNQKGLLHSDQQLYSGGSTDSQVTSYSTSSTTFFADFASAMVKMGNISPLTGTNGEIRTNCRKVN